MKQRKRLYKCDMKINYVFLFKFSLAIILQKNEGISKVSDDINVNLLFNHPFFSFHLKDFFDLFKITLHQSLHQSKAYSLFLA